RGHYFLNNKFNSNKTGGHRRPFHEEQIRNRISLNSMPISFEKLLGILGTD
ncbi:BgTH12-03513, partial [Blumeria graminis f. sp. triticale]